MESYFEAIAAWGISRAINESAWIFPVIQAFHLVALAVLAGALLMVDLRLLGRGFTQQPVATVARADSPLARRCVRERSCKGRRAAGS